VRDHRFPRPTAAVPDHENEGQCGHAGVDVDDGAAGEVEGAPLEQPAGGAEHPCATGAYTTMSHTPRNTIHAENLTRSAIAPVIRAGVMTANIIW
jgi:hypothetical protein